MELAKSVPWVTVSERSRGATRADLERAAIDGGGAGVGVVAGEGECAGVALRQSAAAADHAGEGLVAAGTELERPGGDGGGAGVGVVAGEGECASADLVHGTVAADRGLDGERDAGIDRDVFAGGDDEAGGTGAGDDAGGLARGPGGGDGIVAGIAGEGEGRAVGQSERSGGAAGREVQGTNAVGTSAKTKIHNGTRCCRDG